MISPSAAMDKRMRALPWPQLWWVGILLLYLMLTGYQLGLPGLHYDEAREAGLNAVEILTGAPTTVFRETGIPFLGRQWPLMVQDYIGALNVYLALPLLWLTGIGVPNLRFLSVLIGLVTLILVERTVREWLCFMNGRNPANAGTVPLALPGLLAMTLLTAAPTFVFWSRQGIFVTNLTQPLLFATLWQGIRWLRLGRPRSLLWSAFWGGCALYAKLLALWVVGPFVLLAGGWWLWRGEQSYLRSKAARPWDQRRGGLYLILVTVAAFLLPLIPLIWFNVNSGGTVRAIAGNLETSYYGVDNLALWPNLGTRLIQVRQVLQGDHLWYLGGIYGNPVAFWGGCGVVLLASFRRPRLFLGPLLLLLLAFVASLFTISDLFITHYALLHPLAVATVALSVTALFWRGGQGWRAEQTNRWRRIGYACVCVWLLLDLSATLRYHSALSRSGGLAGHSDASYHLAYYLRYNGLGAPIALDWGFDATVRYLSEGTVTPIEIFGYDSPQSPDSAFAARLEPFLENPANIYLLHSPHATVFAGRREIFFEAVAAQGRVVQLETTFAQRDGTPLYELWRVVMPE